MRCPYFYIWNPIPPSMECLASDILSVDRNRCIGCGKCVSVCIRKAIEVQEKKAVYVGDRCFACFHCYAVCPKGAISVKGSDYRPKPVQKEPVIGYQQMMDFLEQRRSIRWFDRNLTKEELEPALKAAAQSPTAMNYEDVEFVVVDEKLEDFMQMVYEILKPIRDELPRIGEFCRWMEGDRPDPKKHPFLWEGKQLILTFAKVDANAFIAMTRAELALYSEGLGGFYSLFMNMAAERDPERFAAFFPEIPADKKLKCVFVCGHPRIRYARTVPPRDIKVHWS